jgi:hypothetical protein
MTAVWIVYRRSRPDRGGRCLDSQLADQLARPRRAGLVAVDMQLERRHALVPNLVEIVRGSARDEGETCQRVIAARADAARSSGPREASKAEGSLTASLGDLQAIAEGYPDLRTSDGFQQLSRSLSELAVPPPRSPDHRRTAAE